MFFNVSKCQTRSELLWTFNPESYLRPNGEIDEFTNQRSGDCAEAAMTLSTRMNIARADSSISECTWRSIKFGLYNKDKLGILMQQSALKELNPFKSYGSQHHSPFLAHPVYTIASCAFT
uniref:Uncharacterized protein n=1 Tax=Romanomermis culicivorax TaxID=13658 RepID=A0A915I9N1_ROMCU